MTITAATIQRSQAAILTALSATRVEAIDVLRAAVGSPRDFEPALLGLEDAGRVLLFKDADPESIAPERRRLLLTEGANVYTTAMAR